MKIYRGTRDKDGNTQVEVLTEGKPPRQLDWRLDLRRHSPTGIEWGYGGSGPAQLALAILAEHYADVPNGDERALQVYQTFKFKVVAGLPREGFKINTADVALALTEIIAEGNEVVVSAKIEGDGKDEKLSAVEAKAVARTLEAETKPKKKAVLRKIFGGKESK